MDGLIYGLIQAICSLALYLVGYLGLTWLSGRRSWQNDDIWEQPRPMGILLTLSIAWTTVLARCEPYPNLGVLGWGGIAGAIAHLSILALVGRSIERENADLADSSSARPAARYTCGQCYAPVPDWMMECPTASRRSR